ncbi:pentatricopeptide repeat-containing protein At2g13600-like [Tasmannia lanceolata]|uniref:pentatricopeptide repeat-containing protein At2g13600-like n=1 Tax=Tasmannia lanceolata TaxID=3420 RepID=UPI004064AFFA
MFEAQKLHASLLKTGLQNLTYRSNLLLHAYAKTGFLSDAQNLLNLIPHPNVVSYNTLFSAYVKSNKINEALKLFSNTPQTDTRSYNTLITGFVQNQRFKEAISFFAQMTHSSTRPDNFTYTIIIPCCNLKTGRQIHSQIIKVCSCSDAFLGTNLVKMYAEFGEMGDTRKVFDEMPERDLVSWNALIACYSKFGMGEFSLQLFREMVWERMGVDEYTLATMLNEFALNSRVFEAMQVHSLIIRSGFCFDRFTSNALLNFYAKCGFLSAAARVFEEIPEPDVVSWTAMLVGLTQNGCEKDAMSVFEWMRLSGVEPNSFTFGGLLSACASANAFGRGKRYHGLVLKFGLEFDVVVGSAIIDMYSKCGEMNDAFRLFQSMPEKDFVSWNGIICGFAQNGEGMKALELFDEMVRSDQTMIAPNQVTFVGLLSACSHCGLVLEGCRYFNDMINVYKIEPTTKHYTCIIDILARAGHLREAEAFLLALPLKPDSVMWGALLGACKIHGNLSMARRISERIFMDEPEGSSSYVLLANMYVDIGEWGDALEVREVMHSRGAQKVRGSSWIEIRDQMNFFVSGDKYHHQIQSIHEVLQRLCLQMVEESIFYQFGSF